MHPIILDHRHPVTKLLIEDHDSRLCHPDPERVFAEIRCKFWILRGREAVHWYQHTVLLEVEGMLNAKPLGYVSYNLKDLGDTQCWGVRINDRTYTRPVARLIVLPEVPDEEEN